MNLFVDSSSSFSSLHIILLYTLCTKTSALVQFSNVVIETGGNVVCSGTLTDTQTVITASSCVKDGNPSDYTVIFDLEKGKKIGVREIFSNSKWDGRKRNDIALLRLTSKAKYSSGKLVRIKGRLTTAVYDAKVLQEGPRCLILDENYKRGIEVEVVSNAQCSRDHSRQILDSQICVTRTIGNRKKCPVGAGNPIVCKLQFGIWAQVGIHIDVNCDRNTMIATRISYFRAWLRNAPKGGGDDRDDSIVDVDRENKVDPDDVSAEVTCNSNTEFQCSDKTCISMDQVCDGTVNCPVDEEDENSCGDTSGDVSPEVTCNSDTEFQCSDKTCISVNQVCDGKVDCPVYREDENSCDEQVYNETACSNETEFQCPDKSCIPLDKLCDGRADCPGGWEDESSCGCDLAGTEFITGFLSNIGPEVAILYITAPRPTKVTVTIPCLGYKATRTIYQSEKWFFDNDSIIISESAPDKGIHIAADNPVTVIAANSREFSYSTVDGTIVYPVSCLSNRYLVEVQQHRVYRHSQYAIIGAEKGNTDVTIVNKKGRVISASVGYLDAFFLQEKDLRGTFIQTTQNVVVLSGSKCGYVPPAMTASCDHLVNQVPPTSSYGRFYVASPQHPRKGFYIRIRASEDNTNVVLRYAYGDVLESKIIDILTDYVKLFLDDEIISIEADKGIMVTQYALDATIDGKGQGDPSMVILPSLNQFSTEYTFAVPDHFLRLSLMVVISASHDLTGLLLNEEPVNPCGVKDVNIPGYGRYFTFSLELESKWDIVNYASLRHSERDVHFGAILYGTRIEGAFAWRVGGTL